MQPPADEPTIPTVRDGGSTHAAPSAADQLRAWLGIGLQSFGGGASGLCLMRRNLVEGRRWLSRGAFVEDWSISRLSPGMHLVALSALIGRRVGGLRGLVLSQVGILLPATVTTIVLAAPWVTSAASRCSPPRWTAWAP